MKNKKLFVVCILIYLCVQLCLSCTSNRVTPQLIQSNINSAENINEITKLPVSEKMEFWKTQKRGANGLLFNFRPEYFQAAADAGLKFLRFGPVLLPADEKDFLIGDVDNFKEINQTDLALLIDILDEAHKNNLKITNK